MTVNPDDRAKALRATFDEMALFVMEFRSGRMTSQQAQARTDEFFPRMHWLLYRAFATPPEDWNPSAYNLPHDTPLNPVSGPDMSGWVPWPGGFCPVSLEATVEVRYRNRTKMLTGTKTAINLAGTFGWAHTNSPSDIIAYRLKGPHE